MADPINATEILAAANAQAIADGAPTDESLNAGAFLPDEPIADVLTNEVEVDASVLREMLPKLNQEPAQVAQESNYNALAYLRADLLTQKGMTQGIATEALQLLPTFGKGRPVNFYSRHPSQTGYQLAREEIEQAMAASVSGTLSEQANRIHDVVVPEEFLTEKLDFQRRTQQVLMQAAILKDFVRVATDNGFKWDDVCFQGCAVDPSQNVSVPMALTLDRELAYRFAAMDGYYMVHLQAPSLLEFMTSYMQAWREAFQFQLDSAQADQETKAPSVPLAPGITFNSGVKVGIEQAYDVFRDAYEKDEPRRDRIDTQTLVAQIASAAEQSKAEDIIVRLADYYKQASLTGDVLKAAAAWFNTNGGETAGFQKLAEAFTDVISAMNRNVGEIHKWLMCAGLATSYGALLTIKVTEHAWKSVHQCKDTLQMSEADYTSLKTMVEDIQAPQKTGVV